ncbi:unnamed protein product [Didymodactylos carnosus]|uniref:Uncharacterized protein n=1 Tax=Didymodactylos carnosus TaxID=1234261 RepID=A0A8S2EX14_9BILA|nr:unnamed protein product [Didymodactylos carnosus]CAF4068119.1 unnamed protein product [Didymodactylos carnosus]
MYDESHLSEVEEHVLDTDESDFDTLNTSVYASQSSDYENEDNFDPADDPLHYYTHLQTNDICMEFLKLLRDSQISKTQSERFLSFIKTLLPYPNKMPTSMEKLLTILNITNYFTKRITEYDKIDHKPNELLKSIQQIGNDVDEKNVSRKVDNIMEENSELKMKIIDDESISEQFETLKHEDNQL